MKKWIVGISSAALVGFGGMASVHADHEEGTVNCSAFEDGGEVWEFWTSHGYHAGNDPEGLDGDSDGIPCESLTLPAYQTEFEDWEENEGWLDPDPEPVEEEPTTEEEPVETVEESSETEESTEETAETNEEAAEEEADEGDALPATANTYPTMMLIGALAVGAGAVMFSRRKTSEA